jgi:hypothetical protein
MKLPSQDVVNSLLRQGYTAAGTAFTIAAMIAVIPQDAVQPAIAALHEIGDGLQQAFGGFSKLVIILGPVVAALSARAAAFAVTLKSQVAKVHDASHADLVNAVSQVAPTALVKAAGALQGVQVAVSPSASPEMKALASDPQNQSDIVRVRADLPSAGSSSLLQRS